MTAQMLLQFTTNLNLASEETTAIIENWHRIFEIIVLFGTLFAGAKGILNFFRTDKNIPKSLYFTQSFDCRMKKKKVEARGKALNVFSSYVFLLLFFYSFGEVIGYEIVKEKPIILIIVLIPGIILRGMLEALSFEMRMYKVGNTAQVIKWGRAFFVYLIIVISGVSYAAACTIISGQKSNHPLVFAAIMLAVLLGTIMYFYNYIEDIFSKDEYISLGYIMENNKQTFIHYLEGDNYVCSEYAYYNEYGAVTLHEKDWISNKKVYLIDPLLRTQIIDLYRIQRKAREFKTIPCDEAKLIAKGQYKKLTDQEIEQLNKWMDNELSAQFKTRGGIFKKKNKNAAA